MHSHKQIGTITNDQVHILGWNAAQKKNLIKSKCILEEQYHLQLSNSNRGLFLTFLKKMFKFVSFLIELQSKLAIF